ncbi:MAG: hypothetical protein HRU49_14425 [Winogradskyella sp.]|uniref:hypothetical protein n=1 Tax=Winogradskyella sp. TaxID=1883156 RepID=UPI0025CF5AAE|nr:hypothetical protein [Winogradskyella sp.]NRB84944.1 hypothetical protein [Winogradskyella sp.]
MLPKRKQAKPGYEEIDEVISETQIDALIGRHFKHKEMGEQLYKMDFMDTEGRIIISWSTDRVSKSTASYSKNDILRFIREGDWILQPKQTKRRFK